MTSIELDFDKVDDLAAAKGCTLGVVLGAVLWAVVFVLFLNVP